MSVADIFENILLNVLFQNVDLTPLARGAAYAHRHYLGNLSMDEVSRSVYTHASQTDHAIRQVNGMYQHAQEVPAEEAPNLRAQWKKHLRNNALSQTQVARVLARVESNNHGENQAAIKSHFESARRCLGRAENSLSLGLEQLNSFHAVPKAQAVGQYALDQAANLRRLTYRHPMRVGVTAAATLAVLACYSYHLYSRHVAHQRVRA